MEMIEEVILDGIKYAIIIKANYTGEGIRFLTDDSYSQQLAYMHHKEGKVIEAHYHNEVERSVVYTQEVLLIRRGVLRVDFYDSKNNYIESRLLKSGDVILLIQGGHGFKVIEEIEMIEVKQGPYLGNADKTRFVSVEDSNVKIID